MDQNEVFLVYSVRWSSKFIRLVGQSVRNNQKESEIVRNTQKESEIVRNSQK